MPYILFHMILCLCWRLKGSPLQWNFVGFFVDFVGFFLEKQKGKTFRNLISRNLIVPITHSSNENIFMWYHCITDFHIWSQTESSIDCGREKNIFERQKNGKFRALKGHEEDEWILVVLLLTVWLSANVNGNIKGYGSKSVIALVSYFIENGWCNKNNDNKENLSLKMRHFLHTLYDWNRKFHNYIKSPIQSFY